MRLTNYFLVLLLCGHWMCTFAAPPNQCAPIIFKYNNKELSLLKNISSPLELSKNDLQKWDVIVKNEVDANNLTFYQHARLFTYLYVAQEEVANLSCRLKGSYQGTLDPIGKKVLTLFLPNNKLDINKSDKYSETLAEIVFAKIKNRVKEENAITTEFIVPKEKQKVYTAGLEVAKWIPWYAAPANNFWASPPPPPHSKQWKQEVAEIKAAQSKLTEKDKKTIFRWAGKPDHWSDDWRSIANNYFFNHNVPFPKLLETRAVLTISIYDTIIAYMTMKYHYLAIRPKVYDSTVTYLIKCPKHPTYPAGHSSEAASASTILIRYFPENAKEWTRLANESAYSRICAGVHYPVDIKAGKVIGKKVALRVLNKVHAG